MKTNIIKYIILIIIINITDFLSGKSYCNYYNNKMKMYSLDRERNHKSIMNNSLIIENKQMKMYSLDRERNHKSIMNNSLIIENKPMKMYSLDRERNHKSIMNNSLIIENKPMKKPIVKKKPMKKPMKKPILNQNFKRIDINHHIKKKEYHHVNKIKISLKKRIYNFFYKRKNYALIKCFF